MTFFRTCAGCRFAADCDEQRQFSASIKGLRITSVKWRCAKRRPKFEIGAPVWATVAIGPTDDDGRPFFASFPGNVVGYPVPTKAMVFIRPDAPSQNGKYSFEPRARGFCKLSLSRLQKRDSGEPCLVCEICQMPDFQGHDDSCPRGAAPFSEFALEMVVVPPALIKQEPSNG